MRVVSHSIKFCHLSEQLSIIYGISGQTNKRFKNGLLQCAVNNTKNTYIRAEHTKDYAVIIDPV